MNVDSVKKRWKYLKDCYMKDKKKRNEYVASGSASTSKRKSTFKFSEAMSFLSDSMEPRPTSSTLSSTNEGGPPTPPSPIEPVSSAPLHVSTVSTHNASASPASNFSNKTNENSSKRKKSDSTKNEKDPLEEAFIAAVIKEPEGKDSVHHFVMRLAEGLRKLPPRERAKLEIEFLTKIMEVEDRLGLNQ
ncbi:uncharacterized protein [Temnothorax longispinosus]|uniref:uncharacterized protein n=1 Tax=Temnothorax longispinosus TaxID=300112 RepID=UPI003A99A397